MTKEQEERRRRNAEQGSTDRFPGQEGQQKSGGGDESPDPRRERHHVDPGRDEKGSMPRDPGTDPGAPLER